MRAVMRFITTVGLVVFGAGCADSSGQPATVETTAAGIATAPAGTTSDTQPATTLGNATTSAATQPPTTPVPEVDKVSIETLAGLVCADTPTRMGPEAETHTQESWTCNRNSEKVRIDLYSDDAQQATAGQIVLDYFASIGDDRTLAELPLICGTLWAIGIDFNETRDLLIDQLVSAGLDAHTC